MDVTMEGQSPTPDSLTDEATPETKTADEVFQEQMAKGEEDETTPEPTVPVIEVEGQAYELPTLKELLEAGKNVTEKNAAAERKFQETGELRRQLESEKAEIADLKNLHEAWKSGDATAKKQILEFLQEEIPTDAGTIEVGTPAWEDMTKEEQFLYKQNLALKQDIAQLKRMIVPTLEDVKGFVGNTRAEREAQAQVAQIKAEHGIDMTTEQLAEMKENLSNPIKAIAYMRELASKGVAKGTETAQAKPKVPEMPVPAGNQFDPTGLTADEIIQNMFQHGRTPIGSKK